MAEPVLVVDKVKKVIGKRTIISDLSFVLKSGEIFGFLGPNGAGKSTTIKMIVGMSHISGGNIFVNGYSIRKEFTKAIRNIGCIVETPNLYPFMSGLDNLRLFAKMYPDVDETRIDEVVDQSKLGRAIRDRVKTYSLGMKQRLGIAQALLHRPRLLILDEPTNGLDPTGIRDMRAFLRKLSTQTGLTVFVSSHILSEMQQMCDRVGIINKGRIVTIKTVDELVQMGGRNGRTVLTVRTGNNKKAVELLCKAGYPCMQQPEGIRVETERERASSIANVLVDGGATIVGIENANSLEDVYMKLIGEDKHHG